MKLNLLDTTAAASYFGLSPRTLEGFRRKGGGPPYAKLGGRVVYRLGDLERWFESRIVNSTDEARKLASE